MGRKRTSEIAVLQGRIYGPSCSMSAAKFREDDKADIPPPAAEACAYDTAAIAARPGSPNLFVTANIREHSSARHCPACPLPERANPTTRSLTTGLQGLADSRGVSPCPVTPIASPPCANN